MEVLGPFLHVIQDQVYFHESLGELGGVGSQQLGCHLAFCKTYAPDPRSKKMTCLTKAQN